MRAHSSTRLAAIAVLVGALACAGNTARDEGTDEAAAARDTTTTDTLGGQAENPPGYRGMERDTTIAPAERQPSDTFLQKQGVGGAQDTSGYTGAERIDTTGQANQPSQTDTTAFPRDTTGAVDTTSMTPGTDTSWTDTTGYQPSQEPGDTVPR
jgi:hypothetical protein